MQNSIESKLVAVDGVRPHLRDSTRFGSCVFTKKTVVETQLEGTDAAPLVLHSHGDLNLISDTFSIDCNGSSLINVGGLSGDVDDIRIVRPYVMTMGNAAANILDYDTTTDATYVVKVIILAKNETNASVNWFFEDELLLVNDAGNLSFTMNEQQRRNSGPTTTISRQYSIVVSRFILDVTGETGQSVQWKCLVTLFRNRYIGP